MTKEFILKNMVAHIKYDVDLEFYQQFNDIGKIKCLNRMITNPRVSKHFDTKKYKSFIMKFYNDEQFNAVYQKWIDSNEDRLAMCAVLSLMMNRFGCSRFSFSSMRQMMSKVEQHEVWQLLLDESPVGGVAVGSAYYLSLWNVVAYDALGAF